MADDPNGRRKDAPAPSFGTAIRYGLKFVEFGCMNAVAAFEALHKLSSVKSPPEYIRTLTDLTREHFERTDEQFEELSAVIAPSTQPEGNSTGTGFWD
jgi:hypothetical protein